MEAKKDIYVIIPHIGKCELNRLLSEITILRKITWAHKTYEPTPALVKKSNGFASHQFVGQKYDPNYFDLDPIGWTHDHCEYCSKRISNLENYGDKDGYEAEGDWLCNECYDTFIKPESIDELVKNLKVAG